MATKKSSNNTTKSNVVSTNETKKASNHTWVREKDLNTKEVTALESSAKEAKKAEKTAKKANNKSANTGLTKAKKRKIIVISTSTLVVGGIISSMILGPMFLGSGSTTKTSHIGYMPNTPLVDDNSFNEFTGVGVQMYEDRFLPEDEVVNTYTPSSGFDNSVYLTTINGAINEGSDIIISNSYSPAVAMETSFASGNDDVTYILIDDGSKDLANASNGVWTDDNWTDGQDPSYATEIETGNMQGLSVNYMANEAGFIAGLAASVYAVNSDPLNPVVGTFGGDQFNTVYDWMSGYEQAVNWFNYAILGYSIDGNVLTEETDTTSNINPTTTVYKADSLQDLFDHSDVTGSTSSTVESTATGDVKYAESLSLADSTGSNIKPVALTNGTQITYGTSDNWDYTDTDVSSSTTKESWFTGTFNAGDGETISGQIEGVGAEVIFPVAGIQTYDAVKVAMEQDSNPETAMQVIGVDTDATLSTTEEQTEYFLGSATKNLEFGTQLALWYANDFMKKFEGSSSNVPITSPADMAMLALISTPTDEVAFSWTDENGTSYDVYGWNGGHQDTVGKTYWTYGALLTGTYQNNGVGWTDANNIDSDNDGEWDAGKTETAWNEFANTYSIKYLSSDTENASWEQFISSAFSANTLDSDYTASSTDQDALLVELSSETFAPDSTTTRQTTSVSAGTATDVVWWWVPNWSVYNW